MWDEFVEKVFKSFAAIAIILAVGFMLALVWFVAPEAILLTLGLLVLAVLAAGVWTIAEKISDEIAFKKIVKGWTFNDGVQDKVVASLTKNGVEIEKEKENDENPM